MPDVQLMKICFEGLSEQIYVEKLFDRHYKCLETCLFIDSIVYGCEIEADEIDGQLNNVRIIGESTYKMFFNIWPKEMIESEKGIRLKEEIIRMGGYWENAMGGVFIFHLPKDKAGEIERINEILKGE